MFRRLETCKPILLFAAELSAAEAPAARIGKERAAATTLTVRLLQIPDAITQTDNSAKRQQNAMMRAKQASNVGLLVLGSLLF